jgi:hypothetical protein
VTTPLYSQEGFRFRVDDGAVNWLAAELSNHRHAIGANFRLRIEVENTNNKAENNVSFQLFAARNGGGYTQVTTSSTYIQASTSPNFTDPTEDSTDRLTTSSATFSAGELDSDGDCGDGSFLDNGANQVMETEWCLQLTAATSPDDYFDFEVRTSAGGALNNYSYRARVTAEHGIIESETITVGDTATVGSPYPVVLPDRTIDVSDSVTVAEDNQMGSPATNVVMSADAKFGEARHWSGPIQDGNGNLYFVVINWEGSAPEDDKEVWKSSDGGDTWTLMDTANQPTGSGRAFGIAVAPGIYNNQLYIGWANNGDDVRFARYNVSTHASADQWAGDGNGIAVSLHTETQNEYGIGIAVGDTDNDIIIVAADEFATTEKAEYSYSTNGGDNWTSSLQLDDGGNSFDNLAMWTGRGPRSGDIQAIWKRDASDYISLRTATDVDQALGGQNDIADFTYVTQNYTAEFVVYDEGTEEHVVMVELAVTTQYPRSVFVVDGTPEASKLIQGSVGVRLNQSLTLYDNPAHALAHEGGVNFYLYADQTNYEVFLTTIHGNGTSWSTPVKIIANADAIRINAYPFVYQGTIYLGITTFIWPGTISFYRYKIGQEISESDSIGVTDTLVDIEVITPTGDRSVSESDGVTVGDTATVDPLVLPDLSESDAITVGESVDVELTIEINVSDNITIGDTETVDPLVLPDLVESDSVTIGDTATVDPIQIDISDSEAITIGDTATVDPLLLVGILESDSVAVADTPTLDIVLEIFESESITVGDTPTVQVPAVGDRNISELDSVDVGDTATVSPLILPDISETDGIVVGDTVTVEVVLEISVSDGVIVGDTATIDPLLLVGIEESDSIAVGDTPTVQIPVAGEMNISVSDGITVGDTATLSPLTLDVTETESITVGDTPTVDITIEISESEAITIGDTASVDPLALANIFETDAITVVDTPTVQIPSVGVYYINVSDSVSVGESVSLGLPINIVESEAINVADQPLLAALFLGISESDSIAVADAATMGGVGIELMTMAFSDWKTRSAGFTDWKTRSAGFDWLDLEDF